MTTTRGSRHCWPGTAGGKMRPSAAPDKSGFGRIEGLKISLPRESGDAYTLGPTTFILHRRKPPEFPAPWRLGVGRIDPGRPFKAGGPRQYVTAGQVGYLCRARRRS